MKFRPKLPRPPGSSNGSVNGSNGGRAGRNGTHADIPSKAANSEGRKGKKKKASRDAYEERVRRLVSQTDSGDNGSVLARADDGPLFDDASPGVSRLAFVMVAGFILFALLGLIYALLIAHTIFFPSKSSSSASAASPSVHKLEGAAVYGADERQAAAVAENFSRVYLTQQKGEDGTAAQRMIAPYVVTSTDLSLDSVAPRVSGDTTRSVLASSAYRVVRVEKDRYAVYTDNLTTDGSDSTNQRRLALIVYVGRQGGSFGVVAPPEAVQPPSVEGVSSGALWGDTSYALTDRGLRSLLEGYFAAAYGSDASRNSARQFFAPEARIPDLPAAGLGYLNLQGATLYPTEVPKGFDRAYRVEAYVSVKDEKSGQTENQTHLLTVAHERKGGGWLITGSPAAP